jgi:hypothetical protein
MKTCDGRDRQVRGAGSVEWAGINAAAPLSAVWPMSGTRVTRRKTQPARHHMLAFTDQEAQP